MAGILDEAPIVGLVEPPGEASSTTRLGPLRESHTSFCKSDLANDI